MRSRPLWSASPPDERRPASPCRAALVAVLAERGRRGHRPRLQRADAVSDRVYTGGGRGASSAPVAALSARLSRSRRRTASPRPYQPAWRAPGCSEHRAISIHRSIRTQEAIEKLLLPERRRKAVGAQNLFAVHCLKPPTKRDSEIEPGPSSHTQKKCRWSGMTTNRPTVQPYRFEAGLEFVTRDGERLIIGQDRLRARNADRQGIKGSFDPNRIEATQMSVDRQRGGPAMERGSLGSAYWTIKRV